MEAAANYGDRGVMVFGFMGAGKSTMGNTILGEAPGGAFKEDAGADTCTTDIKVVHKKGMYFFDTPGLGDPSESKKDYGEKLLKNLEANIKNYPLNAVLIVKKANDWRVMAEFAWYTVILTKIMEADPNFKTENLILGLTFAEQVEVTKDQIEKFWEKVFKTSGLTESGYKCPSPDRVVRHSRNHTTQDMFNQLSPLLGIPKLEKIEKSLLKVVSGTKDVVKHGEAGVQEIQEEAGCFHVDSIVYKWTDQGPLPCKVSELTYDDFVLSFDPTSKRIFFDEVVCIHQHGKHKQYGDKKKAVHFVNLEIQIQDQSISRNLRVTMDHYVYTKKQDQSHFYQKTAIESQIGDDFLIFCKDNNQENQVLTGKVISTDLELTTEDQAIMIWTKGGLMIVDELVQSCHQESWNTTFMHSVICPLVQNTPSLAKFIFKNAESIRYDDHSKIKKLLKPLLTKK